MWLAPEFHHGPRPLLADFHARVSSNPRACSRLLRVAGRFHCRHSRQRSLRRIHPSSSCNTPFYLCQPKVRCPATQHRVDRFNRFTKVARGIPDNDFTHPVFESLQTAVGDFKTRLLVPRDTVAKELSLPRRRDGTFVLVDLKF